MVDPLCQSMRFREICTGAQVFSMTHENRKFHEKRSLVRSMSIFGGPDRQYSISIEFAGFTYGHAVRFSVCRDVP